MSARVSVKVDIARLAARRASIKQDIADVVAVAAHRIEAQAKVLVPVDTGATKNSIRPEFRDGGMRADIGPTTEYALPLEAGHHTPSGSYVPGRPFMKPALENERKPFVEAIKYVVSK